MKRMTLFFLFILLIFAACKGEAAETTQIPLVAGVSQPTAIPDNLLAPIQIALPTVEQKENIVPYPSPTRTRDIDMTELPVATAKPDMPKDSYPGPVVTATVLADSYPGFVATGTAMEEQPLLLVNPTTTIGENLDSSKSITTTLKYSYRIINKFPHDGESYIQGLAVDEEPGILLEGSGLWGKSSLRRVILETGEVIQFLPLPEQYFGEGITVFDDRIIQLTWRSGVGFVYTSDSFDMLSTFNYRHEGWGITHDGQQLIVSDGTDILHFLDPETLQETDQINVYDEFGPVTNLNELEYMDGEILANVWQTDTIVRINPDSGQITGRIDLTGLLAQEDRIGTEGVLNGIAFDSLRERLFVTGKRWPFLYEIKLVPLDNQD